jgi:hypothetical protein
MGFSRDRLTRGVAAIRTRRSPRPSEVERRGVPRLVEQYPAATWDLESDGAAEAARLSMPPANAAPLAVSSATVCSMSSHTNEIS